MLLTIDSSVYLSSFLAQDVFHAVSTKFLQEVRQHRQVEVILPLLIPFEVSNALERKGVPSEESNLIFGSFYETPHIRVIPLDRALVSLFFSSPMRFSLKTADRIIAETSFHFQSKLITWDQVLHQQTRALLGTQTPEEYLSASANSRSN